MKTQSMIRKLLLPWLTCENERIRGQINTHNKGLSTRSSSFGLTLVIMQFPYGPYWSTAVNSPFLIDLDFVTPHHFLQVEHRRVHHIALNFGWIMNSDAPSIFPGTLTIRNNTERRKLGFLSCGTGNPIDDCWRCDPNWSRHRKRLADCAIGFGRNAVGGRDGRYYVVTDPSDDDPSHVIEVHYNLRIFNKTIRNNTERRKLGFLSCGTGNPIDDCWRCDPNWSRHRKRLADCAIGFGRNAVGGRDGRYYVVTDPSDDDPVNPRPGTLRHAVIQDKPLWIVFKRDMVITLKQELIMNSFKTIDARGVNVHIANGACITIQFITNIIIHGLHIHDCKQTGNAMVRSSPSHYGWRTMADGDGISIFGASHIWIDHNSLSSCSDGLIDAIMGSTAITISNNYFTQHNEVMLLGHSDLYTRDKVMQVTIAYNHFGEGLTQRMPRCRHGYFHVVNNDYTSWEMYAIGGSANPTINSQGNRFLAPNNRFAKEITKRIVNPDDNEWKNWNWRSEGDLLLNGAYFTPSGRGAADSYARASSLAAKPSSSVATLTSEAGVLHCRKGVQC
ncbi:Pectate lyase [Handroanthus impetiginosus]|uniref:Pectate lyase n=1 Tax=Handroanthus impetiginosus TaxID=429701 RepID=A0A2G9IAV5_9LAMI|nr:Pectate lyase [Handroanthus impetiginosus]